MKGLAAFLLITVFGCKDMPYVKSKEAKLLSEQVEEMENNGKIDAIDLTNEEWPRLSINANPKFHKIENESSDIGSGWSLVDITHYTEHEEIRQGFSFMHAVVTSMETQPFEILLNPQSPEFSYAIQEIIPANDGGCNFKVQNELRKTLGQDYSKENFYYRVFEYDKVNDTILSEVVSDYQAWPYWLKILPGKTYLIKWYAKPEFDEDTEALAKGKLPARGVCDRAKWKPFLDNCEGKIERNFLNWCSEFNNAFTIVSQAEIEGFGIRITAQAIGNTKHENRKFIDVELKKPTRILLP